MQSEDKINDLLKQIEEKNEKIELEKQKQNECYGELRKINNLNEELV